MDPIDALFGSNVSGMAIGAGAPQAKQAQGSMRRLLCGAVNTAVATLVTTDIVAQPTQTFKLERMYLNAAAGTAAIVINNIRIATFSLNVSGNPLPADMFLRDAVGTELVGYTAQAAVGMVVNATNPSGGTVQVTPGFVGWSLVEG